MTDNDTRRAILDRVSMVREIVKTAKAPGKRERRILKLINEIEEVVK